LLLFIDRDSTLVTAKLRTPIKLLISFVALSSGKSFAFFPSSERIISSSAGNAGVAVAYAGRRLFVLVMVVCGGVSVIVEKLREWSDEYA
jgi:hypothetical protein